MLVAVCACAAPAPAPPRPPPPQPAAPPKPTPKPPPKVDIDRLDRLLDQGDRALRDNRLLTPIDNCAYDFYREALQVAPNHPAALHGLERVAERYVAWAEQAMEKGRFDTARAMLKRARIVDPQLASIAAAEAQIDMRSTAKRRHETLDAEQLSTRSRELSLRLKQLGTQAKARDAWVIIRARNDAEGRWIYQQMADSPGDRRIRAELTLGAPPGVDLLQIDPTLGDAPSTASPSH